MNNIMKLLLFITMFVNFCIGNTLKCIPRVVSSNWTGLNGVDALIPIMHSDTIFTDSHLVLDYRWFNLPNNKTVQLTYDYTWYFSVREDGEGTLLILGQSQRKIGYLTFEKNQITYNRSHMNKNITENNSNNKVSVWQHFSLNIVKTTKVDVHYSILYINDKKIDSINETDLSINIENWTYWKIHRTKNYLYSDSKSFEFDKNKTCFYISAMYFCPNTTIIINNVSVNVNFSETNFWYTFELCDESKHVVFKVNIDLCNKFISYYIPDTYLLTDLPVFNDCFISTGKRQVTIYIYIGIILSLILLIVAVSIIYYLVKRKYDSEFKGMRVNNSDNEYDRIYMERIYLEIIN
ncbi:uncharacterized protein LOC109605601 isoform X2 [Aethina tumida]|uniref:uncharacterized protein LOC109605601 isoform X2 n=1 Tax=Aethina tumida TaxID=116153 RepID=UPI002148D70A|nr:uncharacterized protein LOC109605601 isoform X2 [Aethina tumida]